MPDGYLALITAPKIIKTKKNIIANLNFNILDPTADPKTLAASFVPTNIANKAIKKISNMINF